MSLISVPRGLFVVLLALLLGACSGTPERSKPKTLPDIAQPVAIKEVWRRGLGAGNHYVFQPVVVGRTVYAADATGQVFRFDDGQEAWRVDLGVELSGGLALHEQTLVVGALRGEAIALAAQDGKTLWRVPLGAEIVAPAVFLFDQVVVRTGDNRLLGLDAKDGSRKWTYQRTIPPLSVRVTAAPVAAERLVFAGYPGGKLLAINSDNGQAVWEGTVAQPKGATELERISDVVAAPVIGAREVCAVAHQGRLACFDLTTGTLLWARELSSSVNLALDHKAVYVSDDEGIVQALDRVSGSTLWKQDKLVNRRLSGPFLQRGYLMLTDDQGFLHALDTEDGAFRGRFALDAGRVESELRAYDMGFVLQTDKGLLIYLQLQD